MPETIQTDNGAEFTNPKYNNEGKVHALDKMLKQLHIIHKLIRPYTPRHDGKVERSHRSDSEGFYKNLRFKTIEELHEKCARGMCDTIIALTHNFWIEIANENG